MKNYDIKFYLVVPLSLSTCLAIANPTVELSCSGSIWTFSGIGSSNDSEVYFETVKIDNMALSVPGIGHYENSGRDNNKLYWRTKEGRHPKVDWAYFDTNTGKFVASMKDGFCTKQMQGKCSVKSGSLG